MDSTMVFGTISSGSNPDRSTKKFMNIGFEFFNQQSGC